jgi:hypothetical protein
MILIQRHTADPHLKFNILAGGNNGNIRNNNNNNNNNSGSVSFIRRYLPDIYVGQNHVESESLSKVNPFHETRDNASVGLQYRSNSSSMSACIHSWRSSRISFRREV